MENFDKQCSSCGECKFSGDKTWSLGGGNHTIDECVEACQNKDECFFASISTHGYCHMTKTCQETEGAGWTRFKKFSSLGLLLTVKLITVLIYIKINDIKSFIILFYRGHSWLAWN